MLEQKISLLLSVIAPGSFMGINNEKVAKKCSDLMDSKFGEELKLKKGRN